MTAPSWLVPPSVIRAAPRRAPPKSYAKLAQVATAVHTPDMGMKTGHETAPAPAGLPVTAAARRLGLAASTLRSWERRYGLGPSLRTLGGHRRYSAGDLVALQQ